MLETMLLKKLEYCNNYSVGNVSEEFTLGNLGWYQGITTFCKKVGGPRNALIIVLGTGYVGGKAIELGVKKVKSLIAPESKGEKADNEDVSQPEVSVNDKEEKTSAEDDLVIVKKAGVDNQGLSFEAGDEIIIRDKDEESVLIEKVGDENNPYYVDAAFLDEISSDQNVEEEILDGNVENPDTNSDKQVETELTGQATVEE